MDCVVVNSIRVGVDQTHLLSLEKRMVEKLIYLIYWGKVLTTRSDNDEYITNLEVLGCILINDRSATLSAESPSAMSNTPPCNSDTTATLDTDLDYKLENNLSIKNQLSPNQEVTKQQTQPSRKHKEHQRKRYRELLKAIMAVYTATFLVWCYCTAIHTDAVVWNKFMKMSNGNRPGKVKEFLNIMYQNLPGTLGVETLSTSLTGIVERIHPDVLFVGEAESNNVKQACPEGYNWVGGSLKNKIETIRVSVLVKDTIPFKTFKINTMVPAVGLKIDEWRLIGIYREWAMQGDKTTKTREQQIERLCNFVDYWLTIKCKSVVIGDFNFDPCPSTEYQRSLESIRTCINDVVLPEGWRQLITGVTRREVKQEPATLDHVYVNAVDKTERTWNVNMTGYDHNLVGVRVKSRGIIFHAETFEYRNLKKVTTEMFQKAWNESNPSDIFNEREDPSEAVRIWEHKMQLTLETVAPMRRITTTPRHNQWMTTELKDLCQERDMMRKEANLWKTSESVNRYKRFRNEVTNKLKKAKFEWRRDHLTVEDSKKWWARVKQIAGMVKVRGEDIVIVREDGTEIKKPEELVEFFNEFFKQKVVKLQSTLKVDRKAVEEYAREYMADKGMEVPPTFSFKTVGTGEVNKVIKNMNNTNAQGRDEISTILIKQFKSVIAPSIRHLVNLSIKTGVYPDPWKVGLITPLPKAGDLSIAKNWRPVVILPAASKILEKILQRQMATHMEEHQIFSPSQHAYRCKRSTESALLELDTHIQKARNEGKVVALILTDMSAAFNLIKKDILLSQLKIYGFSAKSRRMVGSYLSKRSTKCRIKGCMSGEVELDSGVGEGSVVGPGFYICGMCSVSVVAKRTRVEMEELGFWVDAWTLEFADDTSGVITANNEAELQVAIHLMMNRFEHYFNSMGMCLNKSKCELIIFRSSRKEFTQTLPGGQEEVDTVKLLGLYIDNDYRFRTHTEKVAQKLRFKIANLNRVRPYLPMEKSKMLTESLVLSTIAYMGTLYLRLPSNQKKIQRLQNLAARSVLREDNRAHIEDMLLELYWLNVKNYHEYLLLFAMRRIREGLMKAPNTAKELVTKRDQRLRSNDLQVPWTRMRSHGLNSFLAEGCKAYNKYNLSTELFEDEEQFKEALKLRIFARNPNGNL